MDVSKLEQFYLDQPEPNRSCFLSLRQLLLQQDENLSESLKWNMPCFSYRTRMCCFLWFDQKKLNPYILFVEGVHLHHPDLEQGTRKRMKILNIDPNRDIPVKKIQAILNDALDLYRNNLIKT